MVKYTPLHEMHLESGAKMVPFAGYEMPIYYPTGAVKEHQSVRESAGLFDVSHMGQITVSGSDAAAFWQKVTPSYFLTLADAKARYTVLLNDTGGIIDDLIVTKLGSDRFFAVLNAACFEKDLQHLQKQLPQNVVLQTLENRALLALQGPKAQQVLQDVCKFDASNLHYMQTSETDGCLISRLGYTGEDGFEISAPAEKAKELWKALVAHSAVMPVGLAARDSLRLEMGYPLYGHDLDESISPVEACLEWVISKNNDTFLGRERYLKELSLGPVRRRVGVVLNERAIARENEEIFNENGTLIGKLTSGGYSPTLERSIGQGYVQSEAAHVGTKVFVVVRQKKIEATITAMPFIERRTK